MIPSEFQHLDFSPASVRANSLKAKRITQELADEIRARENLLVKNKGGRPSIWKSPTTPIRVPKQFAEALIEIALEWQGNSMSD